MKAEGKTRGAMPRGSTELLVRTKRFALSIINLYSALPGNTVCQVLGKQLLRSATSVGAHYREAQRAKSTPDFIAKSKGVFKNLTKRSIGWNCWKNPKRPIAHQSSR